MCAFSIILEWRKRGTTLSRRGKERRGNGWGRGEGVNREGILAIKGRLMKRVSFVRRAFDDKEYFSGADSSSLLFTDDLTSTKGCFAPSTIPLVPSDPSSSSSLNGDIVCFFLVAIRLVEFVSGWFREFRTSCLFIDRAQVYIFLFIIFRDQIHRYENTIEFFLYSFHTRMIIFCNKFSAKFLLPSQRWNFAWKRKKQLSELIQRDIFGSQHNFCINDSLKQKKKEKKVPLFFIRRMFLAKYFQNVFRGVFTRERARFNQKPDIGSVSVKGCNEVRLSISQTPFSRSCFSFF